MLPSPTFFQVHLSLLLPEGSDMRFNKTILCKQCYGLERPETKLQCNQWQWVSEIYSIHPKRGNLKILSKHMKVNVQTCHRTVFTLYVTAFGTITFLYRSSCNRHLYTFFDAVPEFQNNVILSQIYTRFWLLSNLFFLFQHDGKGSTRECGNLSQFR